MRGVVRSELSATKVSDTFPEYLPRLSLSVIPDLNAPENYAPAFADVLKPITGIISVAAPFSFSVEDNARDLLDPAVTVARSILEAARKYGPNVQRVVTTSSAAANVDVPQGSRPGYTYTEKDWNPMPYDVAVKADAVAAYCASKAFAEKAGWDWVEREKPHFTLTAINPPYIFGPHVAPIDIKQLGESTEILWKLYGAEKLPPFDFGGFVDVRDVATAHLEAFERPEAGGQRFLISSQFNYQSAVDSIRKELPELDSQIPKGTPGRPEPADAYVLDGSKAKEVLGINYIPLAKCLKDSFEELLEANERSQAITA